MHAAAFEFIGNYGTFDYLTVIEIGSRNINGSVRCHFPGADWIGLDLHPGPCVDVVCDAMLYKPSEQVDRVVCCEVFEHTSHWREIIASVFGWLKPGGIFLITCAGTGRSPHSAIDGGALRPDEHYENIGQHEVEAALRAAGFGKITTRRNERWKDTYAVAIKS
jgi:SAM-dependent methyltransferase